MKDYSKKLRINQMEFPGFSLLENSTPEYREVSEDITKRPHVFIALVQNALTIAQSLRDNYFVNTAKIVSRKLYPKSYIN